MATLTPLFVNNFATTLASSVASGATTSFSLTSATGLPTIGTNQYIPAVVVDTSTSPETVKEYVYITAVSGTTATVTRAAEDASRFPAAALATGLTVAAVASGYTLTATATLPAASAIIHSSSFDYNLYSVPGGVPAATTSTRAMGAGFTVFQPMLVEADIAVTHLAISVTTAVASSTAKVVIYKADTTWTGGAAVYTSASIDTSTTGAKIVDLSSAPVTIPRGRYWAALWPSAAITVNAWLYNYESMGPQDASTSFPLQIGGIGTGYPATSGPLDPAGGLDLNSTATAPGLRTFVLLRWKAS